MLRVLVAGGGAAALLAASLMSGPAAQALTPDVDPPGRFTVGLVSLNGSGCPIGTATVSTSPDYTAFTVAYSKYLAQVGMGAKPTDFRKNCQLTVQVNAPQGYTYAVVKADYRGYAYLAPGARGQQQASYYFQGMSNTSNVARSFSGPMDDNWQVTDATNVESLVWSPCGEIRNLNINTQLKVNAGAFDPAATSFMTMDSTDGSFKTIYHLSWRRCTT
ncbi:DUF4360 domain-containing protein [Streptosporangium sp. NPDC000396]|uniref:DUF4360 domain-containing protein n=1 Tax=Streptosporangium sp. NPDC000396 TaxID=3366185 RepID=UPI0036CAA459